MEDRRRFGLYCGVAAPIVSLLTLLLATLVDPEFSWRQKALSDLGEVPDGESFLYAIETGQAEFFLFNGGLVATGLLGLGFAGVLFDEAQNVVERTGSLVYALSLIMLGAVGVFHLEHHLHGPVAITYFALAPLALLWYGAGRILRGTVQFGLLTIAAGVGFVLAWFAWGIWLAESVAPGVAVPEFASALLFAGWSFGTASIRLWGNPLADRADGRLDSSA